MAQTFHISAGEALADVGFGSDSGAEAVGNEVVKQIIAMQDRKKFFNEHGQQLGRKAGVNSGNGYLEAMVPYKLWVALERRDPEFFTDSRKWERFIRKHPELKLDLPL